MKKILALTLLAPFLISCGDSATDARTDTILALTADTGNGKIVFDGKCASCHGAAGGGTGLGPDIKGSNDAAAVLEITISGDGSMPSFSSLSDQELADVTAYTQSL